MWEVAPKEIGGASGFEIPDRFWENQELPVIESYSLKLFE